MNPQQNLNHSASGSPHHGGWGVPPATPSPNQFPGTAPPQTPRPNPNNPFSTRGFGNGITVQQGESANFNYVFGQPGTYNVRVSLNADANVLAAAAAGLGQTTTTSFGGWGRGQASGWASYPGELTVPAIMDREGHHQQRLLDPREMAQFQTKKEFPGLAKD